MFIAFCYICTWGKVNKIISPLVKLKNECFFTFIIQLIFEQTTQESIKGISEHTVCPVQFFLYLIVNYKTDFP